MQCDAIAWWLIAIFVLHLIVALCRLGLVVLGFVLDVHDDWDDQ